MASDAQAQPRPPEADDDRTRWLDGCVVRVCADGPGRLVAVIDGVEHAGVQVSKLFALSDPQRYVCFRDAGGGELGVLAEPERLDPDSLRTLREYLDRQYFIPVIEKVERIREFFIDQTWTVRTDRGPRRFTIQGRDAIRFLPPAGLLLIDTDDNRYLLRDRLGLDPASRAWVDRYVW